jgi:hypothetical protein
MNDAIYAMIEEEKRLRAIFGDIYNRAEVAYFALPAADRKRRGYRAKHESSSQLFAEAEVASKAWTDAISRLRNGKATTMRGVLARLDCLTETGEFDFETAVEVLARIADRQPDIAVA